MLVQRAYKTELDPSDRQVTACRQHTGAARWAYNWGLRVKQERYKATKKSPTAIELHRELNALKKADVPWMYDVSKCAPQEALWNLDAAFTNFFRRCALKKQGKWTGKLGYPCLKTKKKGLGSFRLTGRIVVSAEAIILPRLGRLRLKERGYLPTNGVQILSATVSEQAGHWYVSVPVEQEQEVPENTGPVAGIDLGIKHLATLSDGEVIENPRHLKRLIPILFVDNLEAERDFYVQLGFTVSYQGPEFPDFIALAYGSLEFGIESTPDADPQLPNRVLTWQLAVTDIELAKRRLTSAGVSFQEVWVTPRDDWKYRVLHARTPNGYHLMLEGANE